ncbi:uncharacterized protein LOC110855529 [Folsomia candida]|uniref:uncharacterized protein LOC110855529 n=1 Tax=Folsomia candida TaxID=158441 RepID=UPI000B8FE677|nr:uncharacterized protein LOC110855529 [Folsomia candida]
MHKFGAYDLWVDHYNIWGTVETEHRGAGAYAHTFSNVDLWLNLTLSEGLDDGRGQPLATDVTTSLVFGSCRLWAGNFTTNGDLWDDAKWERQGPIFKADFDEEMKSRTREILLREGARAYFNMYWGYGEYTRLEALHWLIELGAALNP